VTATKEPLVRTLIALAAAVAALVSAPLALADAKPVVVVTAPKFGSILATRGHLALYTWRQEKAGTVRCTGECAKEWPPLTVPKGTMVARRVAGAMGTFGTIRRPDGRTQVTQNGKPLYTYVGDTRTRILCDGVDGWFVVRT
jgi:predicted lipoprotein with Yx(FWY)xxD motif